MNKTQRNAQLFVTCLVDSLFPEVGVAVVEVLNSAGVHVDFPPEQTCCGQPAYNAGYLSESKMMAKHTIELLEKTEGPIVIPSGSCTAMIRHSYLNLLSEEHDWVDRAGIIAERTHEFSEFLVDKLQFVEPFPFSGTLAYHPSCHLLRDLGVEDQPLRILNGGNATDIIQLEPDCCGFGGLFAVEQPEISGAMLQHKLKEISESGASTVVGCDVSCLMQIEGGLRKETTDVRCAHLAQVIAGHAPGLR